MTNVWLDFVLKFLFYFCIFCRYLHVEKMKIIDWLINQSVYENFHYFKACCITSIMMWFSHSLVEHNVQKYWFSQFRFACAILDFSICSARLILVCDFVLREFFYKLETCITSICRVRGLFYAMKSFYVHLFCVPFVWPIPGTHFHIEILSSVIIVHHDSPWIRVPFFNRKNVLLFVHLYVLCVLKQITQPLFCHPSSYVVVDQNLNFIFISAVHLDQLDDLVCNWIIIRQ